MIKISTGDDGMMCLNIAFLLKENGKSKYWLVKELNSNYTVVNRMINNETTGISFDTIHKLCTIFNCTPNDLFVVCT